MNAANPKWISTQRLFEIVSSYPLSVVIGAKLQADQSEAFSRVFPRERRQHGRIINTGAVGDTSSEYLHYLGGMFTASFQSKSKENIIDIPVSPTAMHVIVLLLR